MRILAKVGGAPLLEEAGRLRFARAVRAAREAGHEVLVIHGGGEQIRAWSRRLGLEDHYVGGLRVTDAATAEVVQAVLPGSVGGSLVHALGRVGVPAVSLSGADGRSYQARPLRVDGAELGFVGELTRVNAKLPLGLVAMGYCPVMASVAPLCTDGDEDLGGDPSQLYNVNADHAAPLLAAALAADAVLFLSDVSAVRGADGEPLAELGPALHARLLADGTLQGGMLPKVEAALAAARALPQARVVIASAEREDCLLAALKDGGGTQVLGKEPGMEAVHG